MLSIDLYLLLCTVSFNLTLTPENKENLWHICNVPYSWVLSYLFRTKILFTFVGENISTKQKILIELIQFSFIQILVIKTHMLMLIDPDNE